MAAAEDSMKVTETSLFFELSQWFDVERALPSVASNGLFSGKTTQRNTEETGEHSELTDLLIQIFTSALGLMECLLTLQYATDILAGMTARLPINTLKLDCLSPPPFQAVSGPS